MIKNGDMPAAPSGIKDDYDNIGQEPLNLGLTKRERFAMAAMQGLLSGGYCDVPHEAVNLADALLAELENDDD